MWFWHNRVLKKEWDSWDDPRARATRGLGRPSLDARSWDHPSHPFKNDSLLRPCPWKGASWRAGVGRVRSLNFLSALRDNVLTPRTRSVDEGRRGKARSTKVKRMGGGVGLSAFSIFALALVTLPGCTLFAPREEVQLKQATVEELTVLLSEREAAIQTMKGLFSAKVRGGIIPIASRVEGSLYYRRPNAMRLRGFTPVGAELFEFVQANDQFRLRLPTMGRVLSGNPSDMSEMGKLARHFQLSVWAMGGVLGTGKIAQDETVVLVEEGDRYRLDVFGPSSNGTSLMHRQLWFERQALHVVREDRLTESGTMEATIQYEDFRTIGEPKAEPSDGDRPLQRPFKILLEDGRGQGSVQVTFHEMTPNLPVTATDLAQR
jgi:hypothetical protein